MGPNYDQVSTVANTKKKIRPTARNAIETLAYVESGMFLCKLYRGFI